MDERRDYGMRFDDLPRTSRLSSILNFFRREEKPSKKEDSVPSPAANAKKPSALPNSEGAPFLVEFDEKAFQDPSTRQAGATLEAAGTSPAAKREEAFLIPFEDEEATGTNPAAKREASTNQTKKENPVSSPAENKPTLKESTNSFYDFLKSYNAEKAESDSDDEEITAEEAAIRETLAKQQEAEAKPAIPRASLSLKTPTKEGQGKADPSFQPLENEKLSKEERTKDPSK